MVYFGNLDPFDDAMGEMGARGGGYFHRNAIRGRAAQMGRFLTKNP